MKRLFASILAAILSLPSYAVLGGVSVPFAFAAASARAQSLKVSTGGEKGTYTALFVQMQQACGSELSITPVPSTGSNQNLDRLVGNEVNMGFVQTDVLYRRARTENLGGIKTLLALHPEQLHFVARDEVREIDNGLFNKNTKFVLNDIKQLANLKLAAAGGSVETAKQVKTDSDIGYQIVEATNDAEALKWLATKQADAVLLVGGPPLGTVSGLGAGYKLLSVPQDIAEKLKGAYKPTRITYRNLKAEGIATVGTDALLVTKEYKTPAMQQALSKFRSCVLGKLDEIKETTGTHPAWQNIDGANHGKWSYYELPAVPMKK